MIHKHEFNSLWWGNDVGVVQAKDLMMLSADEVDRQNSRFAWIEARASRTPGSAPIDALQMQALGFFHVDTQIQFKIGLNRLKSTPSLDDLEVRFADAEPFNVNNGDFKAFEFERFSQLPECSTEKINERYRLWSQQLIADNPYNCLRIFLNGDVQGYFLSRKNPAGFELTLAMLHSNAKITGMHLYHKALLAYTERGIHIGKASFSVYNAAVHNIYASLGARFLSTEDFWFRLNKSQS